MTKGSLVASTWQVFVDQNKLITHKQFEEVIE